MQLSAPTISADPLLATLAVGSQPAPAVGDPAGEFAQLFPGLASGQSAPATGRVPAGAKLTAGPTGAVSDPVPTGDLPLSGKNIIGMVVHEEKSGGASSPAVVNLEGAPGPEGREAGEVVPSGRWAAPAKNGGAKLAGRLPPASWSPWAAKVQTSTEPPVTIDPALLATLMPVVAAPPSSDALPKEIGTAAGGSGDQGIPSLADEASRTPKGENNPLVDLLGVWPPPVSGGFAGMAGGEPGLVPPGASEPTLPAILAPQPRGEFAARPHNLGSAIRMSGLQLGAMMRDSEPETSALGPVPGANIGPATSAQVSSGDRRAVSPRPFGASSVGVVPAAGEMDSPLSPVLSPLPAELGAGESVVPPAAGEVGAPRSPVALPPPARVYAEDRVGAPSPLPPPMPPLPAQEGKVGSAAREATEVNEIQATLDSAPTTEVASQVFEVENRAGLSRRGAGLGRYGRAQRQSAENIAGRVENSTDAQFAEIEPSSKYFQTKPGKEVTGSLRRVGTDTANHAAPMFVFPVNARTESAAAMSSPVEFAAVETALGAATSTVDRTTGAEASATAQRAVDAVLSASERLGQGERSSVNLQFTMGDTELSVRVELRDAEVRTTFHTESAELRAALTRECQAISFEAPERLFRLAPPVISGGGAGDTPGFSAFAGDASSQQREARHGRAMDDSPGFLNPPDRSAGSPSDAEVGAAPVRTRVLPTSLHLHTLA